MTSGEVPLLNAVPEELKCFAPREATAIKDGYLYKGCVVIPFEAARPFTSQHIAIWFGDDVVETSGWVTPFKGEDGKMYLFVIPMNVYKEAKFLSPINGIEIHGEVRDFAL